MIESAFAVNNLVCLRSDIDGPYPAASLYGDWGHACGVCCPDLTLCDFNLQLPFTLNSPVVAFAHARDGSYLAPVGMGRPSMWGARFCDNREPSKTKAWNAR